MTDASNRNKIKEDQDYYMLLSTENRNTFSNNKTLIQEGREYLIKRKRNNEEVIRTIILAALTNTRGKRIFELFFKISDFNYRYTIDRNFT